MADKNNDSFFQRAFVTRTNGYLDVFPKRELWRQVANDFKGTFKIGLTSGNVLEILRINIPYKKCEIKISESDTRPMQFEIKFDAMADYQLVIGWEDSIEKLLKRFGKREIEIGNSVFDNHYLIKSNDSQRTLRFFSAEIIDALLKYNVYSISYTTNIRKQTANLVSVISRLVNDKNTMDDLVQLHMKVIDKLEELMIIR